MAVARMTKIIGSSPRNWQAAVDEAVAAPVITAALFTRFRSRIENSFGEKLLSAMRKEFGGHIESTIPVHKARDEDQ